ncbi:unnamed protein product [Auanema sp. JU1783]|nr:unnamed protein product [Auanema sp. JU1783]
MEARYKVELRERDPATIEDLILDNCSGGKISGLTDELVNLQTLSLIGCELESLEGIPSLPNLTNLDVSNNNLAGGLEILAKNCPSLVHLNLANNKISDTSIFECLKDSKLCEIELFSNKFEGGTEVYREKLFALIPTLQILDGCDSKGEEVEDQLTDSEEDISGEDGSDVSDDDGPGLSYLDNSQLDEDETEDYDPEETGEKRGKKRSAVGDDDDEPQSKKDADE